MKLKLVTDSDQLWPKENERKDSRHTPNDKSISGRSREGQRWIEEAREGGAGE